MESLNYKLSQGRLFESSNGEILSSIHTPQDDHTNSFNREFSSLFSEAQYELPFRKPELWGKIEETLKSIVEGKLSLKRTLEWIRFNSFEAENARFSSKKLVEFFTSNNFNDLFPKIAKLVLDSPSIFSEKKIPILKQDSRDSVILSEKQCACLLAHMFMCLTMKQDNPKLNKLRNFFPLLTKNPLSSSPIKERQGKTQTKYTSQKKEKLKGLFFYFKQFFNKKEHEREIKFTRLGPGKDFPLPNWKNRSELLTDFSIRRGKIEEVNDAVEVSFSDPECGATDLLIGATQQPIKFFTSPELILGILFCERIKDEEALLIQGVRQFCIFEGYTVTFQMKEVNDSSLEKDKEVLLLDPIDFIKTSEEDKVRFQEESKKIDVFREYCLNSEPSQENIISPWITLEENKKNQQRFIDQYSENKVYSELNKSYVGFSAEGIKEVISTGSGGCGIYGGNPQLKFVMQWIATSVNNKKMAYNVREELNEYFKDVEEIRKKYVGKSVNLLLKDLLENCEKIQEINSRPNYDNNQNVKAINNLLFGLLLEKKDVVS